ncbi:receptor-like cytoplasmic kinase 176 isoform X4 [Manihot esculenta]|uniref:non-specific serine/threonine protein kinase n=1 Tax=Manihot esculenta TaxID=3983 RepID=A0A2C9VK87_MANES|nr:receptor-like cytoplasmic kinase 176 isoform X3 [Manihot esculenta]XP_021617752.1 receptor-like cytoplasmic kinase 176 isoform X3 [Manihot esculenta]XP_021617753.1 receptor-like cytoplasmic kinase 176 isoform X4 [Manihot esculenta]XP_021617754.1 receptor-like cytoplasmic kinase 176 isoform X4 [Manihot esculenta]
MWSCFKSGTKAQADPQFEVNHDCVGKGGNDTSKNSRKVSSATTPSIPRTDGEILPSPNLESFDYSELKEATCNFCQDFVLGKDGFGLVFKGWIDEHSLKPVRPETGMPIVVKRLNQKGSRGQQEWLAEIKYMGQLHHPNLVKLIGYCLEDDLRLLVYEFVPNGNLEYHLFGRAGDSYFQPLSWDLYVKVSHGAAKALAFLHYKADVIYRDFKTSNILLDSNYNPKLTDLGLAKDGPIGCNTHVSTRVLGTEGYAAPEYIRTGHLTAKNDVYSFGVVLLEMLSGRRAIDRNKPSEEQMLAPHAKRTINMRKFSQVLHPSILGQYPKSSVLKVAQLASQCVSDEPNFRPNMKDVVEVLEELQKSNDNERCKSSKLRKSSIASKYGRKTLR